MVNSPAFIFLLFIVLILSIVLVICSSVQHKIHHANMHSSQIMMAAVMSPNNQFNPPPMAVKPVTSTALISVPQQQPKPQQQQSKPQQQQQPQPKPQQQQPKPAESENNLNITSSIVSKT